MPQLRSLCRLTPFVLLAGMICSPDLAMAQASPFLSGATSLQANILAWLTPVAIILVMILGVLLTGATSFLTLRRYLRV